jgi:hypothetical protein
MTLVPLLVRGFAPSIQQGARGGDVTRFADFLSFSNDC